MSAGTAGSRWSALRREWSLFRKQKAYTVMLLLLALLACLAAANGVHRVWEIRDYLATQIAQDQASWTEKRDLLIAMDAGRAKAKPFRDPHSPTQSVMSGRFLAEPPTTLAALSPGGKDRHSVKAGLGSHYKSGGENLRNPANHLDGQFDLSFVVVWVLPLVAFALTYDSIAGDRESGVMPLLLTQAGSLSPVITTRLLVRLAPLMIIIGLASGAAVWAGHGQAGLGEALAEWLAWCLAVLVYLTFWIFLSGAVSCLAKTSAGACLNFTACWVGFALLAPAAAGILAERQAPAQDRLGFILTLRATDTRLTEQVDQVREAYYAKHPGNRPKPGLANEYDDYFIGNYYPRQLALDRIVRPLVRGMEQRQENQYRALRNLSFLSPPMAMQLLTNNLAGRNPESHARFMRQVDEFQDDWRGYFDHKFAALIPLNLADYDNAPVFESTRTSGWSRLEHSGFLFLVLALLAVASLAAYKLAIRRFMMMKGR
jgi:ABC-2 type transport system permease protein